jgi:exodeoxyribonuclease V beta subunit
MKAFSLAIGLGEGPTLIEASAGTGKTWSIARLVARILVEPGPGNTPPPTISQVLVVTFTNAATAELRERIRAVLVGAAAALQTALDTEADGAVPAAPQEPADPGFAIIAGQYRNGQWQALPTAELVERLARLRQATSDFDLAPVLTIHSFCQRMVQQLAFESHSPLATELSTNVDDLVEELVDDWMANQWVPAQTLAYAWLTGKEGANLSKDRLRQVAKARVAAKGAQFLPDPVGDWQTELAAIAAGERDLAALEPLRDDPLVDFARWFATAYAKKLTEQGLLTFDDLMQRVEEGLRNPDFVTAVRQRLQVALIDEFQDTDAVQWSIFRRLFVEHPGGRLVLIGDPKQAIYRFRNADVAVYNSAKALVASRWPDRLYTMEVNHRSDAALIDALNQMFALQPDVFLGAGIPYQPVRAKHGQRLLCRGQAVTPVAVRWFDGALVGKGQDAALSQTEANKLLPKLVAGDVAATLAKGWELGPPEDRRPLRARDIAVLTATNAGAVQVRDALLALGVPAILGQSGSIFASQEAVWLQMWLTALVARGDAAAARAFASTPLGGWDGEQLLAARRGDEAMQDPWQTLLLRLQNQHKLLTKNGLTAAFAAMMYQPSGPDLAATKEQTALVRLASWPTAERTLTNLRHLAEALEAAQVGGFLDAAGLERWLAEQRRDQATQDAAELRLESDADTVTIMTMHKSKGLQFPLVFLPDLASGQVFRGNNKDIQPLQFHHAGSGDLVVHLAGMDRADPSDVRAAWREGLQERQRLLYVALTRAEHHLVAYAGPVTGKSANAKVLPDAGFERSPLGLLWLGSGPNGDGLEPADKPKSRGKGKGKAAADTGTDAGTGTGDTDSRAVQLREDVHNNLQQITGQLTDGNSGQPQALVGLSYASRRNHTEAPYVPETVAGLQPPLQFRTVDLPDNDWRRESYTTLVGSRSGEVATDLALQADSDRPGEDEGQEPADGPDLEATAEAGDSDGQYQPDVVVAVQEVPLRRFPGGIEAGKWVHAVLEHLAFGPLPLQTTSGADAVPLIRKLGMRNGFSTPRHDALLAEHLPAILRTPMGPRVGNLALADIADAERLNELSFDLPIAPHALPGAGQEVAGQALAALLGRDRGDAGLPAGYLAAVRTMGFRSLRGFLTGSMDLVFRAPVDGQQRWFVADYKTNILGSRKNERIDLSLPEHYATPWMAREVAKKHYYIQYLLYLTALHRFLTLRQSGYDYDLHMGGAVYLFVRGMVGPTTGQDAHGRFGVFVDRPPRAQIEALSALFAGVQEAA